MGQVGWVSASPVAKTGYGRETKEIGFRVIDAGRDVVFIGTFGDVIIWGGVTEQTTPKGKTARILALTSPSSAAAVINEYIAEYDIDMIVGFMDCFGLEFLNDVLNVPVVGYIPIDGPFTREMAYYMRNYHKIVAYSQFGYTELQKWYPPSRIGFIDHAVDTETFRPLNKKEYNAAREWFLENYGIPKDAFLAVDLGANIGPRKLLPLLMHTFSKLAKNHPDAHLFLQTNAYSPGKGFNLISLRGQLGMEKNIHFARLDPIVFPVEDSDLRRIFGAAQVFVHNACAEGCGLPQLESMSCGVPPIAPLNSAQAEHTVGLGWPVDNIDSEDFIDFPVYVPTLQQYPLPSQKSLLNNLEDAYRDPGARRRYGHRCRKYVLQKHAYDVVIPQWLKLFRQVDIDRKLQLEVVASLKK